MKRLAALILALVASVHYGYKPLAEMYPDTARAARAWSYVLQAGEGATLYLLVAFLACIVAAATRSWALLPPLALGCIWGAAEDTQRVVCRVAYPMDKPPPLEIADLCGASMYWIGLIAVACLAVYVARR